MINIFKSWNKKAPIEVVLCESVQPSDIVIDAILNETFYGSVPYQWVNWAADVIGMSEKYCIYHPMTIQSMWVLYEGCRKYKEKLNDPS
ncbi:hypothetical protein [Sulfurovum sp.]|uniref:hypothetical protein n=1 Tax=Sulfurovum sp. TaxID=1969726 RepID=UPI0035685539